MRIREKHLSVMLPGLTPHFPAKPLSCMRSRVFARCLGKPSPRRAIGRGVGRSRPLLAACKKLSGGGQCRNCTSAGPDCTRESARLGPARDNLSADWSGLTLPNKSRRPQIHSTNLQCWHRVTEVFLAGPSAPDQPTASVVEHNVQRNSWGTLLLVRHGVRSSPAD